MNSSEYQRFIRPHERALRQLLLDIDFFIADSGRLNVFSVEGRIKTYDSATEKQNRTKIPLGQIQDLAAIRIVLATSDEVDVLASFFHDAAARKRLKIKEDQPITKSNGYRSRHIILEVGPHTTHTMHDVTVEVQLSTVLQHAYNFISRAWVYKSDREFSPNWRGRFHKLADDLAQLDVAVAELHADVLQSAASGGADEPLTPFAFQKLSEEIFRENVPLVDAVWYTRFLIDLHCATIGQTRAFFLRRDVMELRERFRLIRSEKYQRIVERYISMPLHRFYTSHGSQFEATRELIDSLIEDETQHDIPG